MVVISRVCGWSYFERDRVECYSVRRLLRRRERVSLLEVRQARELVDRRIAPAHQFVVAATKTGAVAPVAVPLPGVPDPPTPVPDRWT
jgi:hypothetical protein